MEADYLKSAIPEPVTILGQRLQPFSLGHNLILRRFDNAFVAERKPELADLLFAVLICAQDYRSALTSLRDGIPVKRWFGSKRASYADFIGQWIASLGPFDFIAKAIEFQGYIAAASTCPDLKQPDGETRRLGAPFIERVQIVLQGRLGYSPDEALNLPWAEAIHHYFAYWELEDRCAFITEEEYEAQAEVKRILAEIGTETHGA